MADKNADFLVDNGTTFEKYNFSTTAEQVKHGATTVAAKLEALDGHNHDSRYYTESEVTALLKGALKVQTYNSGKVTVAGGAAGSVKFTYSAPSGYTEVGIMGYTIDSAYVQPFKVMSKRIDVYNTDSNARTVGGSITVLFAKNSVM